MIPIKFARRSFCLKFLNVCLNILNVKGIRFKVKYIAKIYRHVPVKTSKNFLFLSQITWSMTEIPSCRLTYVDRILPVDDVFGIELPSMQPSTFLKQSLQIMNTNGRTMCTFTIPAATYDFSSSITRNLIIWGPISNKKEVTRFKTLWNADLPNTEPAKDSPDSCLVACKPETHLSNVTYV